MKLLPCVDAVFHLYNTSKKGKKDAVTSALLKDLSFLGVTKVWGLLCCGLCCGLCCAAACGLLWSAVGCCGLL